MGTKSFRKLHVIALGDFYQMASVGDLSIFKDNDKDYGPPSVKLYTDHIYIHSLSEIR